MNKLSAWAADLTSRDTNRKLLTQIHSRPKRNLYTKLRYRREVGVENRTAGFKNKYSTNSVPLLATNHESTTTATHLHYIASEDDGDSSSSVDEDEEEVCFELLEMKHSRHRKRNRLYGDESFPPIKDRVDEFVELEIEPGDTLRSLALRYGCKLAEMKRINNLINDQEFYGLRKIKVPIKKYSFTNEKIEEEKALKQSSKLIYASGGGAAVDGSFQVEQQQRVTNSARENRLERVVCIRDCQDSKVFLQQMDADLERIRQSTKVKKDSLEEVTQSLTCKRFGPIITKREQRFCDMPKFHTLIAVIVLTLVAFPILLYLLMLYKKPI